MAKEIREAINSKAGINDADITEFFEQAKVEEEINDGKEEEAVPTTVTASLRRGSTISSVNSTKNLSTAASASIVNSKAKTKSNQLATAIETASNATMNAFELHFQQRQMAEEFEWKQQSMERGMLLKSNVKRSGKKIIGGLKKKCTK
jgi:hypothetical protein